MKKHKDFRGIATGFGVLALAVCAAQADSINQTGTSGSTYTGSEDGQGSANLGREINFVTIANNSSDLFITIALPSTANIETEGAFNYIMDITSGPGAGGDSTATTAGNPYGRDISIDSGLGGMTDFIGIFGAGGSGSSGSPFTSFGFNDYIWTSGAWHEVENVASGETISDEPSTSSPNEVTLTVPLSDFSNLTLTPGSTIDFDIDSTGTSGAQTAYGALATAGPVQGGTYYNDGTMESASGTYSATYQFNETVLDQYTIAAAPEPTALAFAGLGGLSLILFRRQRK